MDWRVTALQSCLLLFDVTVVGPAYRRKLVFDNPSLITRIAIGKAIGFIFGLIGFIFLPFFLPEADSLLRWGILLWYTTLGAIIGMFGVFTAVIQFQSR